MTRGIHALPVLKTIGHGYQEALGNIGAYVLQPRYGRLLPVRSSTCSATPGRPRTGNIAGPWATVAYYAAPLAEFAMLLFGNVAIAVSAYRAAIRNEPPTWQHSLRLGRREFRYLGLTLVLFVVECAGVILLIVIALMGAHMTGDDRWAQRILTIASTSVLGQLLLAVVVNLVIAATVTPLFGLAFPLAAMDAPAGLLRRAARMKSRLSRPARRDFLSRRTAIHRRRLSAISGVDAYSRHSGIQRARGGFRAHRAPGRCFRHGRIRRSIPDCCGPRQHRRLCGLRLSRSPSRRLASATWQCYAAGPALGRARRDRPGRSTEGLSLRRPSGLGVPDRRPIRYHDQGRRRPEARQLRRRNRSRGEPAPCPCRRMPRRKRRSA